MLDQIISGMRDHIAMFAAELSFRAFQSQTYIELLFAFDASSTTCFTLSLGRARDALHVAQDMIAVILSFKSCPVGYSRPREKALKAQCYFIVRHTDVTCSSHFSK